MSFVLNDDVKIHYKVEGEGECLVLSHGFFDSLEDWYEYGYVDAFKNRYKLILIDSRGHGQSDKPHDPEKYALYLRALDVIKVLDAEKVDKCHFMGYSMGGWIGFGLMTYFKERFNSFILNAVHPFENNLKFIKSAVNTLDAWVATQEMSESYKNRLLANDKKALAAAVYNKRSDNSKALINLEVPCLMLAGEKDGLYKKAKRASKLSDTIEFISIPDADHALSMSKKDFIVPRVIEFLEKIKG